MRTTKKVLEARLEVAARVSLPKLPSGYEYVLTVKGGTRWYVIEVQDINQRVWRPFGDEGRSNVQMAAFLDGIIAVQRVTSYVQGDNGGWNR